MILNFFFFFDVSKEMGRSGNGKRNILWGWPYVLLKKRKHEKSKKFARRYQCFGSVFIEGLQIFFLSFSTMLQGLDSNWLTEFLSYKYMLKGGSRILKWGVNFCNNAREIKYYFCLRDKKKERKTRVQKKGVKIHPFHLPWIRA